MAAFLSLIKVQNMAFHQYSIKHLFPTPLIIASLPPQATQDIKQQFLPLIIEKAASERTVVLTNRGGWQSTPTLREWGGQAVETILEALKELINEITYNVYDPRSESPIDWRIYGWANINKNGDYNVAHIHPGSYWSAVYYLQTEETANDCDDSGTLELADPRGAAPVMYCPQLRWRLRGFTSAGGLELHKPKEGECLLFPSWLQHAVREYRGNGTRISLAFNFSLQ